MNTDPATNRVVVMLAGAVVSPWLDQRFGIKLTPLETATMIVVGYHYIATGLSWAWHVFQSYVPPKVRPVEPAKV